MSTTSSTSGHLTTATIEADPEVYRYVMRPPTLDRPTGDADPVAADTILPTDGRRVVRALEVVDFFRPPTRRAGVM